MSTGRENESAKTADRINGIVKTRRTTKRQAEEERMLTVVQQGA
jgi:hypothetical protein